MGYPKRAFPNPPVFLSVRINSSPREVWTSQSLELRIGQPTSRYESWYSNSPFFPLLSFALSAITFSSPFYEYVPRSLQLSPSLYWFLDPLHSRADYSCAPRSVRYWQSGERHFQRPPFLGLHRFTCCVRSWIPDPPPVSLSAPPHRTLVDFSPEVPLFEWVGRVLR